MIKADIIDLRNLSRELYKGRYPDSSGSTEFMFKVFICGDYGYCSDDWESFIDFEYTKVDSLPTEGLEEIPPHLDNKITVNGETFSVDWMLGVIKYKQRKSVLLNTAVDVYFTYGKKEHKVRFSDLAAWKTLTDQECQDKLERAIVKKDEI